MNNNFKWPRILTFTASVFLAIALFVPIWQIQLAAPQYPEGLVLKIFANGLQGDVDVINGLNHYIGMHTLHNEDFIEFTILPYIMGGLVLLGLVVGYINKKKFYYFYVALFMFVAIASMVDFYRWEYDYGHNLDPNAAIIVPGMAYQPPLIGYKQLLNFGAYSIPDIGGWFFIAAGVLLAITFFILLQPKWLFRGRAKLAMAVLMFLVLQSCSTKPQPIRYGADACSFCKMSIMDKKFACEWVTNKGKVFRYDDLHCLLKEQKDSKIEGKAYVNDFNSKSELVNAGDVFFVKSAEVKGPMGGDVASFIIKDEAEKFASLHQGNLLTWPDVKTTFN